MPKPFDELRERLLRAGVAPRHVRRYLHELADHLEDLRAHELTTQDRSTQDLSTEDLRADAHPADSEAAALARLGTVDDLAAAMCNQPRLQSWSARAPWAVFGLAPVAVLAVVWSVALLLLWSGWKLFLSDALTPFVPIHGAAIPYFGLGRMLYFGAPLFIGWAAAAAAVRQRLGAAGPALATLCVALIAAVARVHAVRTDGSEHVGLSFVLGRMLPSGPVVPDPLAWCFSGVLSYVLLILTVAMLPYLLWRVRSICAA